MILKEDDIDIDSNFAQVLLLPRNHDPKIEQIQKHKINMFIESQIHLHINYSCSIQLVMYLIQHA